MAARSSPWFTLLHLWEVHRPFRIPPTFEKRWDRIGYEGAVTATDQRLEPLIEAAGDNTIVIVIGDHGEEYPEGPAGVKLVSAARKIRKRLKPARWFPALDRKFQELQVGHGFALREQLVRVPLIFRGPGVPLARIADQVRLIDLTPTIADLCGVAVGDVDGRSLVPLMRGEVLPEEPAYIEAVGVKLEGDRIVGVRTPDWKLLKRSDGRSYLYKLNGGGPPNEKRNLYDRYPEVTTALEGYLQRVNDLAGDAGSGMTEDEEAVVEQHLRDLGYL
jgi:arylsulfatase A-like enzyme